MVLATGDKLDEINQSTQGKRVECAMSEHPKI